MAHTTRDRLLRVDLTTETVESERVPGRWLRQYIGGKGLGARYLYEELPPDTDPLGPENVLLFMLGPLSGYLPGEQRYAAVTKSPLSGAFLDSYSGGRFPAVLAQALGDHIGILVTGTADRPVRLEIENSSGVITPAENWGADAVETCKAFPDAAVACIGPAGENRVSYATIASDAGDHHAGRGGAGAVIGAKRLKAVVAYGDPPQDLDALRERYEERYVTDDTGQWQAASETLESVDFADRVGALSARGWQEGHFEGTDEIGIEAARETAVEREHADEPIPGGFRIETKEGETVPRGATQMTLGAGLGIAEFDAVAVLGETCDRLAVDVISAGNAVAWAMRASRMDVIDREVTFGDEEAARALIEEIVRRESVLGDALAKGVEIASERFDSTEIIPTVKGMELPNYDPRGAQSMALAYATSDRGACHRRARPVETEVFASDPWSAETAARTVIETQNSRSVLWSLVVDDFVGAVFTDLGAEWLSAIDLDYTTEELRQTGERIWTLTRLFNIREGFSRADDALPAPLCESLPNEPESAIDPATFNAMLDAYYTLRGWDVDGCPTHETLSRLGITEIVDADSNSEGRQTTTAEGKS
jgi:aldehyde:ferredoxin oxidoreductase